ncbi:MAG: hypothetical protein SW833_16920 [Cyanobacteriota bacterium]|nr:hypothetical protein [Cyanobacteriota bacterium]
MVFWYLYVLTVVIIRRLQLRLQSRDRAIVEMGVIGMGYLSDFIDSEPVVDREVQFKGDRDRNHLSRRERDRATYLPFSPRYTRATIAHRSFYPT